MLGGEFEKAREGEKYWRERASKEDGGSYCETGSEAHSMCCKLRKAYADLVDLLQAAERAGMKIRGPGIF